MEKLVYFAVSLYLGGVLHFVGDYLTQNHWMAVNKTKSHFPAFVHALIYSLPFVLLVPSLAWWIIFITHFFIDRYRLAIWHARLINAERNGYPEGAPAYLTTWLIIIIDNTYHLIFNTLAMYVHYLMR